jgi:hypothetical protein
MTNYLHHKHQFVGNKAVDFVTAQIQVLPKLIAKGILGSSSSFIIVIRPS